jgi:hypothetical protein
MFGSGKGSPVDHSDDKSPYISVVLKGIRRIFALFDGNLTDPAAIGVFGNAGQPEDPGKGYYVGGLGGVLGRNGSHSSMTSLRLRSIIISADSCALSFLCGPLSAGQIDALATPMS